MKIFKFFIVIATLSIGGILVVKLISPRVDLPPIVGKMTSFQLTDQEDQEFELASMQNKIWVGNFFFTSCKGPCPLMTQRLVALQKELEDVEQLQFVSISVDPTNDQPAVLKAYAEKQGADLRNWHFLTGDLAKTIEISQKIFKLPAGTKPDMHSTRLVLIDQDMHIRGYYDSHTPEDLVRLKNHILSLIRTASLAI